MFTSKSLWGGIGVDWAVLALTGATTVTPNQVVGGIAAGLTGAKGKVSEHLFFNNTIPVIFSKMEALRKEVYATIMKGLASDVNAYPLMQALNDLDDYYRAGTIPGALNGIVTTAGKQSGDAKEEINKFREQIRLESEQKKLPAPPPAPPAQAPTCTTTSTTTTTTTTTSPAPAPKSGK